MPGLLESSKQYREELLSRNLYTPNNPYDGVTSEFISSIDSILSKVKTLTSFNISGTIVTRLLGKSSPLGNSSIPYYIKSIGQTILNQQQREYTPVLNTEALFDKNSNQKLFNKRIDFDITKNSYRGKKAIGNVIDSIFGSKLVKNPLPREVTAELLIQNTGEGQLNVLYTNINQNRYKRSNSEFLNVTNSVGFEVSNPKDIINNNTYYVKNKYLPLADGVNTTIKSELINTITQRLGKGNYLEYGNDKWLKDFGKTNNSSSNVDNSNRFKRVNNKYGFSYPDADLNLVWGKDGTSTDYRVAVAPLDRDRYSNVEDVPNFSTTDKINSFNINDGLLLHTKQLLNARGRFNTVDSLRKKFELENGEVLVNGSKVEVEIDGSINSSRQHSMADPYNRLSKAIRYEGNKVYGGNPNSVIYDSVKPRIHPTIDKTGLFDNKNLFFTIENLAVTTIPDQEKNIAYLDDEFATVLPITEAGENGGRKMWFVPYDLQFSEQINAKREVNEFLGRNEPLYTYKSTERFGTLSFKLIIDHPPQVKGQNHNFVESFLTFGGEGIPSTFEGTGPLEDELKRLQEEKDDIIPSVVLQPPNIEFPDEIYFYFPNDEPFVNSVEGSIISIIDRGYEDGIKTPTEIDGRDFGLNSGFEPLITQVITTLFTEENLKYIKVDISGYATKLFLGENEQQYNNQLGLRRSQAAKGFIDEIYQNVFQTNSSLEERGVKFTLSTFGSELSSEQGDTPDSISQRFAKEERAVKISFSYNGVRESVTQDLTPEQIKRRDELDKQIQGLSDKINSIKARASVNNSLFMNTWTSEDGIFLGYRGVQENKFMPSFYSQTPEDLHRRLTFLQQCMRQGNPIKKIDNGSTLSSTNSVFGRQPVQVLRIGDHIHSKIVIDTMNFEYTDSLWDVNPEGMGAQFRIVDVSLNIRIIGGQSLETPIDELQNALSFNYYANSTFYKTDVYGTATKKAEEQIAVNDNLVNTKRRQSINNNLTLKQKLLT